MSKGEVLELEGRIVEVLPSQMFKVELDNGHPVTCYTGGKMRQFKIRLVAGDRVKIEMTPYDLNKGRIIFRLQVDNAANDVILYISQKHIRRASNDIRYASNERNVGS